MTGAPICKGEKKRGGEEEDPFGFPSTGRKKEKRGGRMEVFSSATRGGEEGKKRKRKKERKIHNRPLQGREERGKLFHVPACPAVCKPRTQTGLEKEEGKKKKKKKATHESRRNSSDWGRERGGRRGRLNLPLVEKGRKGSLYFLPPHHNSKEGGKGKERDGEKT